MSIPGKVQTKFFLKNWHQNWVFKLDSSFGNLQDTCMGLSGHAESS